MSDASVDVRRYPVGRFSPQENYSRTELEEHIKNIEGLPAKVESLVKDFSSIQFDTPYRDGGWTGRQVIHHLADSHMNAYIRIKWTITEATPTIKAYDEKLWAETPEVKLDPIISLSLLKALHIKFAALLRSLSDEDLQKEFLHPETKKHVRIDRMIALYSWHGEHHLGHLRMISQSA